jgi:hypothetical protein
MARTSLGLVALLLVCGCGSDASPGGGTGGQGGGAPTGGSGGSTSTGGSGGSTGTGGAGGSLPDGGPSPGDPSAALDTCFAGLRALATFNNQIATKRSADGRYTVRLALEYPPGFVGTSGTVPWATVRFAIVTPQGQLCIQDEKMLAKAYQGSLHNCMDSLEVTANGLTYKLKYPDTSPPERPDTILSISGATTVAPVTLATVSCKTQAGEACGSGGPCK